MRVWLQRGALPVAYAILLLATYAALWPARFSAGDLDLLARGQEAVHWARADEAQWLGLKLQPRIARELWDCAGEAGGWLGGLWLACSRLVWSGIYGAPGWGGLDQPGPPQLYRLEQLACLALAGLCLAAFTRRLTLPWLGRDHAQTAGWVAGCLLAVHPLNAVLVGTLAARGQLLALALGAAAGAALLKGRQERRPFQQAASMVLLFLAALCGPQALWLPALLAAAEYLSARRYRRVRARLRTAATTLVLSAAVVGLAVWLRLATGPALPLPASLAGVLSITRSAEVYALVSCWPAQLGLLVLPINAYGPGALGTLCAGLLFLLSLRPLLMAARAAPRLWGAFLALWSLALILSCLAAGPTRVGPHDLREAAHLTPGVLVMVLGLSVASTAISGWQRWFHPLLLVSGYACLLVGNLLPFERAGLATNELAQALSQARLLYGDQARYLVVDAPASVYGIEAAGDDPSVLMQAEPGLVRASVRGLTREGLLFLMREPEFAELRRAGQLVVVVPQAQLASSAGNASPGPGSGYVSVAPPRPREGAGSAPNLPSAWRGDSRSPDLSLDPLGPCVVRVTVPAGTHLDEAEPIQWRAAEERIGVARHPGVALERGSLPVLLYDLSASLSWRLSHEVRRVWWEGSLSRIELAEFLADMPGAQVRLEPRRSSPAWNFSMDQAAPSTSAQLEWSLELFDPSTWAHRRLAALSPVQGELVVPGAEQSALELERERAGLWWAVCASREGQCVWRARGRIAP